MLKINPTGRVSPSVIQVQPGRDWLEPIPKQRRLGCPARWDAAAQWWAGDVEGLPRGNGTNRCVAWTWARMSPQTITKLVALARKIITKLYIYIYNYIHINAKLSFFVLNDGWDMAAWIVWTRNIRNETEWDFGRGCQMGASFSENCLADNFPHCSRMVRGLCHRRQNSKHLLAYITGSAANCVT